MEKSEDSAKTQQVRREWTDIIVTRLEARYGVPKWHPHNDPLEELIACILSQHTSDINSWRAFEDLKRAYPDWSEALEAPTEQLEAVIRHGGLAKSKAPRIQAVLQRIKQESGAITLDFLKTLSDGEARAFLMDLPGVGPKTAAIVLCFALGRQVLPVDTHVFRVAWRLGLIEKKIGEARAHDALQVQIASEQTYRFHVALITHGRQVCKAPNPRCQACVLTDMCRWYAHESRKPSFR